MPENTSKMEIKNEKNLFKACIRKLQETRVDQTRKNKALYPILLILLGEKTTKQVEAVKSILDDNWGNSRYLYYISIKGEKKSWTAETICTDEELETYTGEPMRVVDQCVEAMLKMPTYIYEKRDVVKLEILLDSAEENGVDYYDLYREIKTNDQYSSIKTLHLMLNEDTEYQKRSDSLLKHIGETEAESKNSGMICLLSNHLKNNGILGEDSIWMNYRLVADIILLCSNKGVKDVNLDGIQTSIGSRKSILKQGINTVSYALIEKPFREIVTISLQELLKQMIENEEEIFQEDMNISSILKRLSIDEHGRVESAKKIYDEEVKKKIPPKENMYFLPFRDEKEAKKLSQKKDISESELSAATLKAWDTYKEMKIRQASKDYMAKGDKNEKSEQMMYELAKNTFSYIEYLKMSDNHKDVIDAVLEPVKDSGTGSRENGIVRFHISADNEARAEYYNSLKAKLAKYVERRMQLARDFRQNYQSIQNGIEMEGSIGNDIQKSVTLAYTNIVSHFVKDKRKGNEKRSAFPEIFDIEKEKEELIDEIWKAFCNLCNEEEYGYDYEKELQMRLDFLDKKNAKQTIKESIETVIDGNLRLGPALADRLGPIPNGQCFYLINREADYVKQLQGREDYILFDNSRTDCIEEIQVYSVPEGNIPERLFLISVEKENENQ